MKKMTILLFVYLISYTICYSHTNTEKTEYARLKTLIDSIQKKYAPDKRVELFDITVADHHGKPVLKGVATSKDAYNELLFGVQKVVTSYIDSIELLPAADLDGKTYGIVNVSVADIRVNNDFEYEMATQSILGTPLKVLQKKGKWSRVQTPDGYIAWTHNLSFTSMTKDEFNIWTQAPKIVFTDYFGFAYLMPDEKGRRVSDIVNGNILKYEGVEGDFFKVSYPDGRIAYIKKGQGMLFDEWINSLPVTPQNIVNKAYTLMGIPYTWGGTSVKGMDCSGFTKSVLFMFGVILMRDASQQVNTGIPVDITNRNNLQIGDLMFFGKKAEGNKKERIRHVGFYIGDNKFIHASGYVRISSMNPFDADYDEQNTKEFVRASRVVGAIDTEGIWKITNNPFYQLQK